MVAEITKLIYIGQAAPEQRKTMKTEIMIRKDKIFGTYYCFRVTRRSPWHGISAEMANRMIANGAVVTVGKANA